MRTIKLEGGIEQTFGPISVDKVEPHRFNDKKWQAQLRQEVTTTYPAARANDSLQDALFAAEDFGPGKSYVEKRVTWVPAAVEATVEQVEELLRQNSDAVLQKTLSMEPILSEEQKNAMETGLSQQTIEDYLEKSVKDDQGNEVQYGGKPFYRSIAFKKTFVEDVDLRSSEIDANGPVSMAAEAVTATAEHAEAAI